LPSSCGLETDDGRLPFLVRPNQDRATALFFAAKNGRTDCVQMLLQAGADKNTADYVRALRGMSSIALLLRKFAWIVNLSFL
jgi:ankyrin repeat protein